MPMKNAAEEKIVKGDQTLHSLMTLLSFFEVFFRTYFDYLWLPHGNSEMSMKCDQVCFSLTVSRNIFFRCNHMAYMFYLTISALGFMLTSILHLKRLISLVSFSTFAYLLKSFVWWQRLLLWHWIFEEEKPANRVSKRDNFFR